jgi:hypothetical protein
MNRYLPLLIVLLLMTVDASAADRDPPPRPNWNRASAAEAVDVSAARQTLAVLYRLAREGQDEELMSQVKAIAADQGRSDPERDRILHILAQSLGDLGPGLVGTEVLEFLATTRSRALVPHDDRGDYGIPMYNIRAAASGALAEWKRLERSESEQLTGPGPDITAFKHELTSGESRVAAARVRRARVIYTPEEIESVLVSVTAMPDAGTASLVLAELAGAALDRPAVPDLLFGLLEHPDLGATAALTLARSDDPAILARLMDTADSHQGLAALRAKLAIDTVLAAGGEQ